MIKGGQMKAVVVAALAMLALAAGAVGARAAQCGNTSAGFETWKQEFAAEARGKGVGAGGASRRS